MSALPQDSGPTSELAALCADLARCAKAAARVIATVPTAAKNRWLLAAASALDARQGELLEANARDVANDAALSSIQVTAAPP